MNLLSHVNVLFSSIGIVVLFGCIASESTNAIASLLRIKVRKPRDVSTMQFVEIDTKLQKLLRRKERRNSTTNDIKSKYDSLEEKGEIDA